jgi:hypothetical protein
MNAWANSHLLGQPDTFLAKGANRWGRRHEGEPRLREIEEATSDNITP